MRGGQAGILKITALLDWSWPSALPPCKARLQDLGFSMPAWSTGISACRPTNALSSYQREYGLCGRYFGPERCARGCTSWEFARDRWVAASRRSGKGAGAPRPARQLSGGKHVIIDPGFAAEQTTA